MCGPAIQGMLVRDCQIGYGKWGIPNREWQITGQVRGRQEARIR